MKKFAGDFQSTLDKVRTDIIICLNDMVKDCDGNFMEEFNAKFVDLTCEAGSPLIYEEGENHFDNSTIEAIGEDKLLVDFAVDLQVVPFDEVSTEKLLEVLKYMEDFGD